MKYIFDTSAFIALFRKDNYDKDVFPTLWENFDMLVSVQQIISAREVRREIESKDDDLAAWAKKHSNLFHAPSERQTEFIKDLFSDSHFQGLIKYKKIVSGGYEADPFVIAYAYDVSGCVVTQEKNKPNAPCIPAICGEYEIQCVNLVGFMRKEKWQF